MPKTVNNIGKGVFKCCRNIVSITIPKGVKCIGDGAFSGCSSLTTITIPQSVKRIENDAFAHCTNLSTITIPKSMTKIGDGAFYGCDKLTAVHISDIAAWCNIDFGINVDVLYGEFRCICHSNPLHYAHNLYLNGELATDLFIPDNVTSIKSHALYGCRNISAVNLPKNITSIGGWSFSDCTSLNAIIIPKGVKSIGKEALKNTGITYLTILGKPTIEKAAFEGCSRLADVYCYSEVPPAHDKAFDGLDLSRITLHISENAMEQYKNTEPWSRFGTIVAIK